MRLQKNRACKTFTAVSFGISAIIYYICDKANIDWLDRIFILGEFPQYLRATSYDANPNKSDTKQVGISCQRGRGASLVINHRWLVASVCWRQTFPSDTHGSWLDMKPHKMSHLPRRPAPIRPYLLSCCSIGPQWIPRNPVGLCHSGFTD